MKVLNIILVLNVLFLPSYLSCNQQSNGTPKTNKNISDTILKDIPLDIDKQFVSTYRQKNKLVTLLNLDTLERGSDSISIRVWCNYAFKDSFQIIAINNTNGNWIGYTYLVEPIYIYDKDKRPILDSMKSEKKEVKPNSGWTKFINDLYILNIIGIPDMSKTYGDVVIADGDLFAIEISTKNRYRFYQYQAPSAVQNKVPEAKTVLQILELIEKELNFKRLD